MGEEFHRDPFVIFKLRGKSREELIGLLGGAGGKTTKKATQRKSIPTKTAEMVPLPPEPLTVDISAFWNGRSLPEDLFGEVRAPSVPAALLKRLGSFPFWRGEERFLEAIEPIYTQASPRGLEIFLTWSCPMEAG